MTTLIYNVNNSWCFLNIYIKQNNTYWMDWEECEFINDFINTKIMSNKNILCIKDDTYCYYETNTLTYHSLHDKILSLCMDDIKSLSDLNILNDKYENKVVFLNKK